MPTPPAEPGRRQDPLAGVVDLTLRATRAYGRDDLGRRMAAAVARARRPRPTVVVVGEFKQGKSSLVNGLVGRDVCPVDDDIATSVPTAVLWADRPTAAVVRTDPADEGAEPTRTPIPLEEVAAWATEAGRHQDRAGVQLVEVGIPSPLLQRGLVLVDTPGAGGLGSPQSLSTFASLPLADAALFVTAADQELTAAELDHLRTIARLCPAVRVVLTKVDLHAAWREIVARDRELLAEAGIAADVVPFSAHLRRHALAHRDARANEESGIGAIGSWLFEELQARVGGGAGAIAAHALAVVDELEAAFLAERAALGGDDEAAAAVAEARRAAEQAARAASRWAVVLGDQLGEVTSDADHDLRARLRDVARRAEEAVDEVDPAVGWEQFERWLHAEVAGEVGAAHALLHERLAKAATSVAGAAGVDPDPLLEVLRTAGFGDGGGTVPDADLDLEVRRTGLADRGLTALRAGYGGVLMFGMLGSLAGFAVATPIVLALGAVMGRKGVREATERELAQRRAQAKAAVRRYLDEVSFAATKDARDVLRRAHRALRDHAVAAVEARRQSAAAAVAAAERAAAASRAEREARLADVDAELARLAELRRRIVAARAEVVGTRGRPL